MEIVIRGANIYRTARSTITHPPRIGDFHPMLLNTKLEMTEEYCRYCLRVAGCAASGQYISSPLTFGQSTVQIWGSVGEAPPTVSEEAVDGLRNALSDNTVTSVNRDSLSSRSNPVAPPGTNGQEIIAEAKLCPPIGLASGHCLPTI